MMVDFISIDTLRGLGTVLAFVAFIAICLWAYSSKRRDDFEQAANLPFADEDNLISRDSSSRKNLSSRNNLPSRNNMSSRKDQPSHKENAS